MNNLNNEKILEEYKTQCSVFSADNEYRKKLANAIGLNETDYFYLRSIIGENEFKELTSKLEEKNYMPGARLDLTKVDSHDNTYIESGEFCANLHIHTLHSDGVLSIKDLLEQACELANLNKEKQKSPFPLLLAITDHDCIDGVKEAVIEISKNPTKYENLKLVLGVELSTITNKFNHLKKPLLIHTHMFCINPFDKELNKFIDKKRDLKLKLANETIKKLNIDLNEILTKYNIKLTLEEAALIHELVTKGQDEVYLPMKKYVGGKLLFTHYVLNNEFILNALKENNIDILTLSYEKPYTKYKFMFKDGGGYSNNYKKALNKYLAEEILNKTQVFIDFTDIISKENELIEKSIEKALEISKKAHPSLDVMPEAFDGFEDTLQLLSTQQYGIFSIAHPGRTVVKDVDSDLFSLFDNMFSSFKKYAKEKAFSYEGYYQAYNGKKYLDYLEPINNSAKKQNLMLVGGLDTHGELITRRGGNP